MENLGVEAGLATLAFWGLLQRTGKLKVLKHEPEPSRDLVPLRDRDALSCSRCGSA